MNESRSEFLYQYVLVVEELVDRCAQRVEALERLLVEKGVVVPEELSEALQRLNAQTMVDRAFDPQDQAIATALQWIEEQARLRAEQDRQVEQESW